MKIKQKKRKKMEKRFLQNNIISFLHNHTADELWDFIERTIVLKASIQEEQYDNFAKCAKEIVRVHKLNQTWTPNWNENKVVDISVIENPKIKVMEENCTVVSNWIKRKDLKHLERFYLMAIYMKAGRDGEKRLKQILQQQLNYKEYITNTQIENYKKKNQFYGIGCKKLISNGFCTNKECKFYAKSN